MCTYRATNAWDFILDLLISYPSDSLTEPHRVVMVAIGSSAGEGGLLLVKALPTNAPAYPFSFQDLNWKARHFLF